MLLIAKCITIDKRMQIRIEAMEMLAIGKLKICSVNRVSNQDVLVLANEERSLMKSIRQR